MAVATRGGFKPPRKKFEDAPEELWTEFKATGAEALRNELIEHYLPIVKFTAERLSYKLPRSVDVEDLMSAGVFGLMDAIDGFDPERGVKFKTYCTLRVKGACLDYLRKTDWVPRLVRNKATSLERAIEELEGKLGRMPSDFETAAHLGMTVAELDDMVKEATATQIVSLSNTCSDDDGGKAIQTIDTIASRQELDPSDRIQANDFMSMVHSELGNKERLIVMLYYDEEMTMREIGMILDLSESRVCQLHARIIKRLRSRLEGRRDEFLG